MRNSIRFSKQIPISVYARFANYAKVQGLNERDALIQLINTHTEAIDLATITPPPQKPKPLLTAEEKTRLAWLEKQDFKTLSNNDIDELNELTIKKRGGLWK